MGDGVPVKKRWKIDFSSVCNKNVISFSKAMKGNNATSQGKAVSDSTEPKKDEKSAVGIDVETTKSNIVKGLDNPGYLTGCKYNNSNPSPNVSDEVKIPGDFSDEKYKRYEELDEGEELDYNELDDDVIHRTKILGIADYTEMETVENSDSEDNEDEEDEEESVEEKMNEDAENEVLDDVKKILMVSKAGEMEINDNEQDEEEEEEDEDEEEEDDEDDEEGGGDEEEDDEEGEEEEKETKKESDNEIKEEKTDLSTKSEDNDDVDESLLDTSLCFELYGNDEFKEDISVVDETSEKVDTDPVKLEDSVRSEPVKEVSSKVQLFEPLSPQPETKTKCNDENNKKSVATPSKRFDMSNLDLDLDDPSSPPLMVSKPADMKPLARTRVTKKKKVMVIQTYNSGSEEEPEVKVRPQRRSKPSMMDLRDQHRIFNTTSFVKERNVFNDINGQETPPEPYHPPPTTTVSASSSHGQPIVSVRKEEIPVHNRLVTSSSDDAEDSLPLSQFVPKKVSSDKEDTKADRKLLKKVKKRKLKKKKKDPEEPQKPVSAYALFFRDMQSSIKAEKPEASFGEISKIVANQWDALEGQKKTDYKKKTETAKKEYLKQLAAYKANKISSEPLPEPTQKPEPVPVTAVPPSFVPPTPVVSGHLYSAQQSEQHTSPTPKKSNDSHEHHPRHDSSNSQHHVSSNQRLDFASSGAGPGSYQPSVLPTKPGICVNEGCTNLAIEDNRWDREYCSTECVVQHCRDAFQSWVMQRQDCFNDSTAAIY